MKIEYAFVRDITAKSINIAGTDITCQKQVDKRLIHKAVKMYHRKPYSQVSVKSYQREKGGTCGLRT